MVELETPVDPIANMALPFAPSDTLPLPVLRRGQNRERKADWNHINHPRLSPILLRDIGGAAIRHLRVQWAEYGPHHDHYHMAYSGPPLPETADEQFTMAVMGLAGYLPETALDVSTPSVRVVPLSGQQRHRMWHSGEVQVEQPQTVRTFMWHHIFNASRESLPAEPVRKLLSSPSGRPHTMRLAQYLLNSAVEQVVPLANSQYSLARRQGLLPPSCPASPGDFIKSQLMAPYSMRGVTDRLKRHLAEQRRSAEQAA